MKNQITGLYDDEDWYGAVTMDGEILLPGPSLRVFNHSPDGFSWGYAGSGCAQLALAVLLAAGIDKDRAVELHQDFKRDYIQKLPRESFTLEVDVVEWANRQPERLRSRL